MSFLTYYVPGMCRPSVLTELREAYNSSFGTQSKVEKYCDLAERLYTQGCVYSARVPLSLAGRTAHNRIVTDYSYGDAEKTECLCKIARLRSLLNPSVFPQELVEAVELANKFPDREKNLLPFQWTRIYQEMGKACHAAGDQPQAKKYLEAARKYARMERPAESVDSLIKIATLEKEINIEAARITLRAAVEDTRGMWEASYAKVYRLVSISDLYVTFDPEEARAVRNLAQAEVDKMRGRNQDERECQSLVDKALISQ